MTNNQSAERISVNPLYRNVFTNGMAALGNRAERKFGSEGVLAKLDGGASLLAALVLAIPAAPTVGAQALLNGIQGRG
jgi:hypothetical protein